MANYSKLRTPGGPGVAERQLSSNTGLRAATVSGISSNASLSSVASLAAGTAWVAAAANVYQTLPINRNPNLPFPCTPCITFSYAAGIVLGYTAATWTVRVTGIDQFDRGVSEVLEFDVAAHANTADVFLFHVWTSRVFAAISKVEVKCTNALDIQAVSASVGSYFTWDDDRIVLQDVNLGGAAGKDEEQFIFNKNQGIGIPRPILPTHSQDAYVHRDIRSFLVEIASAVVAENSYANVKPFAGGAGGGGYIIGQYRGASDTINAKVYNYGLVDGDDLKLRIDHNATDTLLAMDGSTPILLRTASTTVFNTSTITRYTLNVYSGVGGRVGGLTGSVVPAY